ncbi:fatty-acid-binding protein 2 [Selaginella moellendorffii]|uniref:fatty-acid-binding protein 2 n=1 Tax=Selaginella moellendorffii TaxID=88036 RepID=UPI000D1D1111|nr:fatty-acid-binding protein 2 [Selaginella moellendorffii]|eukprot:XP_024517125.1 fatty-acid-binding protein 2 [Selaginella moellendorffii]
MDAGWSAVCDWAARAAIPPRPQVFSLNSIVGTLLGGLLLSIKSNGASSSTPSSDRTQRRGKCRQVRIPSVGESFSRASSVMWTRMWGAEDKKCSSVPPVVLILAAAIWPPLIVPPPCEAALTLKAPVTEITMESDTASQDWTSDLTKTVVEPHSGVQFPLHLLGLEGNGLQLSQVLGGVGVRCRQLMKIKSINLYAFGMYVHPESLRAQLGEKYAGVSPSDLKFRSEFYDDLLRHEVSLTVRMVVLYKGLTVDLVRSAFQVSLRNRLRKIKGAEDDEGLQIFCSYLSGDLKIHKGTVIDIHWQPGGRLQTVVDGRRVGTIFSENLCRAFFDLYIGDPPVSSSAKHSIGESFARILNN